MTGPETNPLPDPETVLSVVTDSLTYFNSRHRLGYDEEGLMELLAEVQAGKEVEIPMAAGIWTQVYSPENEALRKSLDDGWAYSFEEWLWEHGQRLGGIPSEELRNPATGRLTNPVFIAALTQTGKAVELTGRTDKARGEVVVNNVWSLQRRVPENFFLPLAVVHSVDADVGEISYWESSDLRNGPSFLRVPHPILVARKLVLLPSLELPST